MSHRNTLTLTLLAAALTLAACQSSPNTNLPAPSPVTPTTRSADSAGWVALFNGTYASLENFRNYNQPKLSVNWSIRDGSLTNPRPAGDFITRNKYTNFDLRFSFLIPHNHNSGVLYRVIEQPNTPSYHSGPEYQIIDDTIAELAPDGTQSTAANYALHKPSQQVSNPAGQWNRARILVQNNHVEHWLNGVKVVEYEINSDDWSQRVANSKFNEWPQYAQTANGHIAFQDHGDQVFFRDIRIKPLN